MDKKFSEEEFLEKLDEKIGLLQEPVHQVFDKIESLIDSSGSENLELSEFKLQLCEIVSDFYENLVTVHEEIIAEYGIDKNDQFSA